MKSLAVVWILCFPFLGVAQGVFTNTTHTALQQVIGDYPNHFRNIIGNVVSEDPQSTDYISKVRIPGASEAVVTRYSSADKAIYSWRCVLAESEDYEPVARKYKEVFNQIKNSIIKIDGQKPLILNGVYEAPSEDKRFNSSSFHLLPKVGSLQKVKVELTLEYFVTAWKISLLVYDQEEESVVMD